MNLSKFVEQDKELEELERIACYYYDFVINNYMEPGRVESWLMVIDMGGIGITQLPVMRLKGFLKAMQRRFRGRMFRTIAINSHWLLRAFWATVTSWMDAFIQ